MFYSHNEDELMAYGYRLGRKLQVGDVLVLTGNLGAGKTTLTKGIAKGLDIDQMIKSPTYTIVREYEGRLPLYHLDVYRIGNDPDSIDLDDFFPDEQLDSTMVGKSQNQMSLLTFEKSKQYANKKYKENEKGIHSGRLNYMFLEISKDVRRKILPIGK